MNRLSGREPRLLALYEIPGGALVTCTARHNCACEVCVDRREERARRQLTWTDPLMALYALQASGLTFDEALAVTNNRRESFTWPH